MRAAILAVGSELLGTDRLDTNSLRITETLHRYGVPLVSKGVVGDSPTELSAKLRHLTARCELVVVTGGLGPTSDDVTREAVAEALELSVERQERLVEELRRKFARFGREMPDSNRKQADVIEGAEVLANPRGTAPGQRVDHPGGSVFLLPGPPREMEGLLIAEVEPWLRERGAEPVEQLDLKVACLSESTLEHLIQPYYEDFGPEGLSILSSPGEVLLQVTAEADVSSEALAARRDRLAAILGDAVFARTRSATLEGTVAELLIERGSTVVTAESCTGGLVAERLTRIPGSSAYFLGAAVAYSYELKSSLLGVDRQVIERYGAVSREVVTGMAEGARQLLAGDFCIALSGVAGPGGGTDEKPVGTIDLALAAHDDETKHVRIRVPGDRDLIRQQASQWALDLLRRHLVGAAHPDASHLAPRAAEASRTDR